MHKEAVPDTQTDLLRPDAKRASYFEQDRVKERYSCCCSAVQADNTMAIKYFTTRMSVFILHNGRHLFAETCF